MCEPGTLDTAADVSKLLLNSNIGGKCACVGWGYMEILSILCIQFCWELKTDLKKFINFYYFLKAMDSRSILTFI